MVGGRVCDFNRRNALKISTSRRSDGRGSIRVRYEGKVTILTGGTHGIGPALLIFGPILFPISRALGVDPVHYGIVIVAAMGIAFFLPPAGVGLSIASGVARVDVDEVGRSYFPYLVVLLVGLALIAAFPGLTLVLPRVILGYRG